MKKKLLSLSLFSVIAAAQADVPKVVATIKPLHSLVAQVMEGVGEPKLLMTQGSPHGYQMRPSDATAIADADVLFYVDDHLETFLPDVLEKAGKESAAIEWTSLPEVSLLKTRTGGMWPPHEHGHDHDDHDGHDHDGHDHDGHDHDGHDHDDHDHDGHDHDGHDHGEYDLHIWLDQNNSIALVNAVAATLAAADPEHKNQYQSNAKSAVAKIKQLNEDLDAKLQPIADKAFMSFHDAYQYFEQAHGLKAVGVVRVSPEHEPGAARVGEIHEILNNGKVVCLFNEPQFPSKLTAKLVEGTQVHTGTLDPIGADLSAGAALYGQLLTNLGDNLYSCLSK